MLKRILPLLILVLSIQVNVNAQSIFLEPVGLSEFELKAIINQALEKFELEKTGGLWVYKTDNGKYVYNSAREEVFYANIEIKLEDKGDAQDRIYEMVEYLKEEGVVFQERKETKSGYKYIGKGDHSKATVQYIDAVNYYLIKAEYSIAP